MVSCSTSSPVVLTLLDRTLVHRPRIPSQQCWYSFAAECKLSQIWLFRDLRRGTTPRCPLSGCLSSVACRVRSVQLAIALLCMGRFRRVAYGQAVGICRLQTSCDHATGFIQCRVQCLCVGGAFPHRASIGASVARGITHMFLGKQTSCKI